MQIRRLELKRVALRNIALEVFASGASAPGELLSAAISRATRDGLSWLETFTLVEELEKISGLKLKPDNLNSP